jgi:DNA repair protein SbcC/Rad50
MILKKLQIENLRSYKNQEIDFPLGSTLLSGDIGSGKTTILLAIEFALFGLQPSQKGASLLRTGSETGKVILEFEIEGKNIIIERGLKKGKKAIAQDYASITIDEDKFEGSVTEVKSKVLTLLNYPVEFAKKTNLLYKFTVYTPQEEMKQIILESGEVRLNTLRHVFGIDKYKRIEENASFLASKMREKIRLNEGMVYDLEENKEEIKTKEEILMKSKIKKKLATEDYEGAVEFRRLKEEGVNEIKEKIDEKRALENEKSKSDILISEKQQQITSLENNIKGLRLQIEDARKISFSKEEFDTLDERIKFKEGKEEELQKEYIEIISEINTQESKKKEIESLIQKISTLQKCPTCLQGVSEEYKKNIFSNTDEEMQQIQKKINEFALRKNQLIEQIEIVKKTKGEYKNKKSEMELLKVKADSLKEKEERIIEIEKQKGSLEKDNQMLEKHLKTIEQSISEFSKYDSIFEQRNKELIDSKTKEESYAIKKAEINKEIQFLEQEIKEKQEKIDKKEKIKVKNEKIRELEYWVSEKFLNLVLFTEKQVMLTLKEEFSKLFSQWFSILVSESLNAKLDDSFSPVIEQQDYELDYAFLSGGERTAIALAYRLSLNQIINSLLSNIKTSNLVILDEPTDGFSAQQLDKIRDVLNQLNTEQLILVSHEQKIEGFVDNIIRFTKDSGITKVGE